MRIATSHNTPRELEKKNEKKDVTPTLPELPPNAFFLTSSLHPNSLLCSDKKTCKPIPTPIPIITIEFSANAAFIEAAASSAGVVITTIPKYTKIVINPTRTDLKIEFSYSTPYTKVSG